MMVVFINEQINIKKVEQNWMNGGTKYCLCRLPGLPTGQFAGNITFRKGL